MMSESRHVHFAPQLPHRRPHHHRRHSWPPFKLHLPHLPHHAAKKLPIDDDPQSYFLSPTPSPGGPDADETYIFDYMSASIETSPRARSLSPHRRSASASPSYFRPPRHSPTTAAVVKLRKWMQHMEARYLYRRVRQEGRSPASGQKRKASSPPIDGDRMEGIEEEGSVSPVSPPRGRKTLRRSRDRAGGRVRSHSGRPRVWQLPSEDIWPVLEEEQEEDEDAHGLGITV